MNPHLKQAPACCVLSVLLIVNPMAEQKPRISSPTLMIFVSDHLHTHEDPPREQTVESTAAPVTVTPTANKAIVIKIQRDKHNQ